MLLHYVPPDQVKWSKVVKSSPLRLTIPLRVIEQLDEKKYTARDDLAGRARDYASRLVRMTLDVVGEYLADELEVLMCPVELETPGGRSHALRSLPPSAALVTA